MVRAPCEAAPPTGAAGLRVRPVGAGGGFGGGLTVRWRMRIAKIVWKARTSTADGAVTARVVALNVVLVWPAGTVIVAGTWSSDGDVLSRLTVKPPVGAGPVSVNVAVVDAPPVTGAGANVSDDIVTGRGGGGSGGAPPVTVSWARALAAPLNGVGK